MVILLVFHAGDPGSILVEGNILSSSILFSHFCLYILQQELSSVLHKIKRTSQKFSPTAFFFFFFFYINFQIQNALSHLWLWIYGYVRHINQQSV